MVRIPNMTTITSIVSEVVEMDEGGPRPTKKQRQDAEPVPGTQTNAPIEGTLRFAVPGPLERDPRAKGRNTVEKTLH